MLRADNIIFRCRDEWGRLNVHEEAGRRYLSFGNEVEQSCIDMHRPAHLCYQYTQAMMLGCLFGPTPQKITLLGLGAGSLAQALLAYLPRDKRLKVCVCDAYDFLNSATKPADLIFADLFLGDGMDDLQAQQGFLTACRMVLKPGGLLVANYWRGDTLASMAMNQTLEAAFNHPPTCLTTTEGNCIPFAFDGGPPRIDSKRFLCRAKELGETMEIPLQQHARTLLHQNRLAFRNSEGRKP